jgi:hypothetical protein
MRKDDSRNNIADDELLLLLPSIVGDNDLVYRFLLH